MSGHILALDDASACDVSHAGGKAAHLAGMARAGVRVPPGFVVVADAWREFLAHDRRDQRARSALARLGDAPAPAGLAAAAQELQCLVLESELPAALAQEIEAAYRDLGAGDPAVAVRSSATVEDAAEDSFAGQYESYLWVRGDGAVVDAVRRCWASLFTASALAYARRHRISLLDAGMAVVVQAMVRARASGVMFTCDPASGDPSVVCIEGSWGLGSAVVGGEVTPDQYTVAKPTMSIAARAIRAKEVRHVPVPDGGTRVERVPDDAAERACLSDAEVLELARIGRELERLYGGHQDVEWSVDERLAPPENVFVVQCRPETIWSRRRREPVLDPGAGALGWIAQTLSKGA